MIEGNIKKYCHHLPTCNIMQDWSKAEQAMADTPEAYRDESWYIAMDEIAAKRSVCTCGLDELLNKPNPPAKSAKEFIKNIYGDNKADWESNQCDIRFNLSDIAQLCEEFAATQNNILPSAEGAEQKKTCVLCNNLAMDNGLCFEHNGKNKQQQPTAEGAGEKTVDDCLNEALEESPYGILTNETAKETARKFAALTAGKMVEEKLRAMTERCKKLEFMIENGLGWKDMENDITMPHEL